MRPEHAWSLRRRVVLPGVVLLLGVFGLPSQDRPEVVAGAVVGPPWEGSAVVPGPRAAEPRAEEPGIQVRIYTINRGKLDEFVAAWSAGVYPLRQAHGFRIPAAWVNRERNEFIWVVRYEGSESWEVAEERYYGSAGRAALDPDPAQWIAQANQWFVEEVPLAR